MTLVNCANKGCHVVYYSDYQAFNYTQIPTQYHLPYGPCIAYAILHWLIWVLT
jgi:hypothetical protein